MTDRLETIVTVFGGTGFVGRYVCESLFKAGVRVRVAARDPREAYFIQPLSGVGQLGPMRADLEDRKSVAKAVAGADSVINLTGSFGNMQAVHVEGAKAIAEAARDAGAKALVHVSSIGADAGSDSNYGRTKGEGENAVRDSFPGATIIRPSLVFGAEDDLTNRFARLARLPVLPVLAPRTTFQPVYVRDLAQAIAAAATKPVAHAGKTYEIGGPQALTFRALNEAIIRAAGLDTDVIELPDIAGSLMSRFGWLPGAPMTRDQWLMLKRDNIPAVGSQGLEAFGIKPTPLAAVAPDWLARYSGNRFARRRVDIAAQ